MNYKTDKSMTPKNKLPIFAKIYLQLRPMIIPFEQIEKQVPNEGNVVDVGCGFGIFANFLASRSKNRKVTGIDLNKKRIDLAKTIYGHLPNLNFFCGDITDTQIPPADVITVVDVLHHIPSNDLQKKLLKSFYSVLSEGGRLIVKDVDTKPFWKYLFNLIHDYLMTKGEPVLYQDQKTIKNLLKEAGFKLEKIFEIKKYPYAHVLYIGTKTTG